MVVVVLLELGGSAPAGVHTSEVSLVWLKNCRQSLSGMALSGIVHVTMRPLTSRAVGGPVRLISVTLTRIADPARCPKTVF